MNKNLRFLFVSVFSLIFSLFFSSCPVEKQESAGVIDFTNMNYNMVTAKLFNVLIEPEKYLGKQIKFRGQYFAVMEEGFSEPLHSVLIYDATACCQTGLQFMLPEGKAYPEEKTPIEISGVLSYKEVNGMDYFYVACEDFTLLQASE